MTGRTASFLLLTLSVVVAFLLFAGRIGGATAGLAFAAGLAALGVASGGFRRR